MIVYLRYNYEMNKKIFFLTVLITIICSASFFMITESARYYNFFYNSGAWQPLYLAGLLELFVLVLATIKIKAKWYFQSIQKVIMVGIFFAIIFAAGMQAIEPTMESLTQINRETELVEILKDEVQDLKKDKETFIGQKQKRNTAIAAIERRKVINDLTNILKQDITTNTGIVALINIILLFSIRFLVQISNIFCATLLGNYYREKKQVKKETRSYKQMVLKKYPNSKCITGPNETFQVYINGKLIVESKSSIDAWRKAYEKINKVSQL